MYYKSKKGSILDIIMVVVIAFILFTTIFVVRVAFYEINQVKGSLVGTGDDYVEEADAVMERMETKTMPMYDKLFIGAIIGYYLAIFILAGFLRLSPAFLPIMIIITMITVVLSIFVANAHETIASNPAIAPAIADMVMTNAFLSNLPLISLFMCVAISVIMMGFSGA